MEKSWRILGQPVHLSTPQKLLIRNGNLKAVLEDLGKFPAIKPWLGEEREIRSLIAGESGTPGAQQRRRFGRFLFANNVVDKFVPTIQERMKFMITDGAKGECTFHIFATLGGGTGSGTLVDVAVQLRKHFPKASDYKICVYVLVTSDGVGSAGGTLCQYQFGVPPTSGWLHIAATYDRTASAGQRVKLYINGSAQATTAIPFDNAVLPFASDIPFTIGSQLTTGLAALAPWAGDIDDVRLHNRALSAAEISNLYNLRPDFH
jgi:hypothetical protein